MSPTLERPVSRSIPPPTVVRELLGQALRDVELLRGLLRLSERAHAFREIEADREREGGPNDAA
jgi:hypothetical protein